MTSSGFLSVFSEISTFLTATFFGFAEMRLSYPLTFLVLVVGAAMVISCKYLSYLLKRVEPRPFFFTSEGLRAKLAGVKLAAPLANVLAISLWMLFAPIAIFSA